MSHGDSATVIGDESLPAVLVTRRPAACRAAPRRQWSPGDRSGPWAVQVGPGLRPARDCCTARAAGGGTDGPWPAPHAGLGAAGAGRGPGRRAGQPPALGPRDGPSSRSPLGCGPGLHAFPLPLTSDPSAGPRVAPAFPAPGVNADASIEFATISCCAEAYSHLFFSVPELLFCSRGTVHKPVVFVSALFGIVPVS